MPVSPTPVALAFPRPELSQVKIKIIKLQPDARQKLASLEPRLNVEEMPILDVTLRLVRVARNRAIARAHPYQRNPAAQN